MQKLPSLMDQQFKYKKADMLDLSIQPSSDSPAGDQSKRIDVNECKLRTGMKKNQKLVGNNLSKEEIKIRGELESAVERNLEEEIKDGIYRLALRLHHLYEHRKERKAGEALADKKNKALSEVNISIRMEGGTKIEIKEMKKEAQGRPWSSRSEYVKPMPVSINKKFDWATSLRSGMDPTANVNKKSGRRVDNNAAAAGTGSASGQRKGSTGVDMKAAHLGWK